MTWSSFLRKKFNISKGNNALENCSFQICNYVIDRRNHQWMLKPVGQSVMGNATVEGLG